MTRTMKGKPHYESNPRNQYGAVDYLEGNKVMSTPFAGIQPQKLADDIEGKLNEAVENGSNWTMQIVRECRKEEKSMLHDFWACIEEKGLKRD